VQSESATLFEMSNGRCAILLLCDLLTEAVRVLVF
jgi:hypothetical protein